MRYTYPEDTDRDDMTPLDALREMFDLWASGAFDDRNTQYVLDEVMGHIERLDAQDISPTYTEV